MYRIRVEKLAKNGEWMPCEGEEEIEGNGYVLFVARRDEDDISCKSHIHDVTSFEIVGMLAGNEYLRKEVMMAALAIPQAWAASPWLKHAHMLVLNEQSRVKLGGFTLTYSEEIGLQWEKEGDEA